MLVMEIQQTINRKSWFCLSHLCTSHTIYYCIMVRFHSIFTEFLHSFLLLLQTKTIFCYAVSACLDSFHNRLFGLNNEDAFGFRYLINHMFHQCVYVSGSQTMLRRALLF